MKDPVFRLMAALASNVWMLVQFLGNRSQKRLGMRRNMARLARTDEPRQATLGRCGLQGRSELGGGNGLSGAQQGHDGMPTVVRMAIQTASRGMRPMK